MLVSTITDRVAEILQDVGHVTWTAPQLIGLVNDALRSLVLVRADASSVTASIQLAPGTRQALSATADLRFIKLTRNTGPDGQTAGRAIRQGDMAALDAFSPDWHVATANVVVREYMFDESRPREFWVNPPVHATTPVWAEAVKSVLPTEVNDGTDTLPVDAIYAPALIEWVLYRAFSRDSEETPNWQRAARHFVAFFNLLQVKQVADMAINPKIRERVQAA